MALETDPSGGTYPGTGFDFVAEFGGLFVVDLVAKDDPVDLSLIILGGSVLPVSDSDFLDPADVGDVVDVAKFVDVGGLNRELKGEDFRSGGQSLCYSPLNHLK